MNSFPVRHTKFISESALASKIIKKHCCNDNRFRNEFGMTVKNKS